MIVLPLFWDQFDNAQRMAELGFGVRLPTYDFEDDELHDAVARLLADGDLRRRMAVEGGRIRARDGRSVAADLIEETALRDRTHG
jgi:UDP:flavonoid glycosyltransferase YjiC (YdhE family)